MIFAQSLPGRNVSKLKLSKALAHFLTAEDLHTSFVFIWMWWVKHSTTYLFQKSMTFV